MIVLDLWWLVLSTHFPLCSLQLPVRRPLIYIFNYRWIDSCSRENQMCLQMLVWSASHFLLRNIHQLLSACTSAISSMLTKSICLYIYIQLPTRRKECYLLRMLSLSRSTFSENSSIVERTTSTSPESKLTSRGSRSASFWKLSKDAKGKSISLIIGLKTLLQLQYIKSNEGISSSKRGHIFIIL